jgi:hypothetical protein
MVFYALAAGKVTMYKRNDVLPALIRPGMYAGEQGERTEAEWRADAVVALLNPHDGPVVHMR